MVYKLQIEILHPMSTTPFPITLLAIPHVLLITVCTGINQSISGLATGFWRGRHASIPQWYHEPVSEPLPVESWYFLGLSLLDTYSMSIIRDGDGDVVDKI